MSTNTKLQAIHSKRYRLIGDPTSPEVYLLKRKPGPIKQKTPGVIPGNPETEQ